MGKKNISVEKTPEGVVVQIIRWGGSTYYLQRPDGTWDLRSDPSESWRPLNKIDVPKTAVYAAEAA